MASVTFLTSVGGSGLVITDDANKSTGLADGGHRDRFVPALAEVVAVAEFVVERELEAAASAAAAAGGASTNGTSSSTATLPAVGGTLTIGNIASDRTYQVGMKLAVVSTTNPTTKGAYGTVSAWTPGAGPSTGSLSIVAEEVVGSGSVSGWSISVSSFGVPKARTITGSGLVTGGGDLTANRVLTVSAVDAAKVRAGTSAADAVTMAGLYSGLAEVALQDGASIFTSGDAALDMSKFVNAYVVLGGDRLLPNPINTTPGKTGRIRAIQPPTGGPRGLTFGSYWYREGGPPTPSTPANAVDIIDYDVISPTYIRFTYARMGVP